MVEDRPAAAVAGCSANLNDARVTDLSRKVTTADLLHGKYLVLRKGKKHPVFGSLAKAKRFRKEDRRGHRSEYRSPAGRRAALRRSNP